MKLFSICDPRHLPVKIESSSSRIFTWSKIVLRTFLPSPCWPWQPWWIRRAQSLSCLRVHDAANLLGINIRDNECTFFSTLQNSKENKTNTNEEDSIRVNEMQHRVAGFSPFERDGRDIYLFVARLTSHVNRSSHYTYMYDFASEMYNTHKFKWPEVEREIVETW